MNSAPNANDGVGAVPFDSDAMNGEMNAPGASATPPSSCSSGAHAAAVAVVNSTAWPPCECPITTQRDESGVTARAARTMSIVSCASAAPMRYGCTPGVPWPS